MHAFQFVHALQDGGTVGTVKKMTSKGWVESFNGQAVWPALPLPPVEEYEADLQQRFDKLKDFLCDFIPGKGQGQSELEGGEGHAANRDSGVDRVCLYSSPSRHFRARCRFALNRGGDGYD